MAAAAATKTDETTAEADVQAQTLPVPTFPAGMRPLGDLDEDERARIFQAAQNGDAEALRCVLWSMALEPERGATMLNFPMQIRRNMIEASANARNGLARMATEAQCEMVRADLLSTCGGSALERLLVDRIVTCWLAAYLADGEAAYSGKYGGSNADYYLRRQDRAHRRLLQSIEALARVQRLMRPGPLVAMQQLNIAGPGAQQVNVQAMQTATVA